MKKMIIKVMIILFFFNGGLIQAEDSSWYEKAKNYSSEIVSKAKEKTQNAIDVTKEYSSEITDKAKEKTQSAITVTKEYSSKALKSTKKYSSEITDKVKEKTKGTIAVTKEYSVNAINTTKQYSIKAIDKTKEITTETIHDIKTDDVTFESFYKESSSVGWIIAAVIAIVSIVAIVYTGGTATPAVTAIGTWIGNTMGLSGIAATNAGLALLGGGSIASGGFGIIGGTLLLTGALTFGTEVIIDYTMNTVIAEYSYGEFTKNSKNMMTLPLPKNTDGCDSYEKTMKILEKVDTEKPISSEASQMIIQKAIKVLDVKESDIDADEESKKESLFALLYFISNNYEESKKHANLSIELANKAEVKHTISSYIFATSSLYNKTFDYNKLADNYLKYSFLEESDNPLIPLLLSIHMDRMMYRYSDGMIDEKALKKVFNIILDDSLKELRLQNYIIVLSRYIIAIKLEQQKISSLSITENKTIKNSPKTLEVVKKSYKSYDSLLEGVDKVIFALELIEVEDETEIEAKKQVAIFKELIRQYDNDKVRLQRLIKELGSYQASLES